MVLVLRENDVRSLLSVPDAIEVLDAAFRRQGADQTRNQPRSRVVLPEASGVLHVLSAYVPGEPGHPERDGPGLIGLKTYAAVAGVVRFVVLLFSAANGELLTLMEADWLGQARTGAASGVATRHMARSDVATLGLIGVGGQARTQLLAAAAVRPLHQILVYGRDAGRTEAFCEEMSAQVNVPISAVPSAEEAVTRADIVTTATTAREPVLLGEWLRPGTHVNAMGSNWHNRREVDDVAVERSGIVAVDALDQARIEAGDLLIPAAVGRFDFARVVELGRIVAGQMPGRHAPDEITLFKSLGIALEDVAAAGLVYVRARERHVGDELRFVP